MKVVIDTNVFTSSFMNSHSPPAIIRKMVVQGVVQHCYSASLLDELTEVLNRAKLRRFLQVTDEELKEFLHLIDQFGISADAIPLEVPVCRDPKDDHVLATALAAKADAIVTGDQDLLVLGSFQGIVILTPAQLVERFAS